MNHVWSCLGENEECVENPLWLLCSSKADYSSSQCSPLLVDASTFTVHLLLDYYSYPTWPAQPPEPKKYLGVICARAFSAKDCGAASMGHGSPAKTTTYCVNDNLCIARHYLHSSKSSGVLPVVQRLHPSQTRSWRRNLHHTGCVSLDYSPRRANHQTDDGCLGPSSFKVLQSPTLSRRSLGCRGNRSDLALSWNCQVLVCIALSEPVFRLLNKSTRSIREESCLLWGKAALSCKGWIWRLASGHDLLDFAAVIIWQHIGRCILCDTEAVVAWWFFTYPRGLPSFHRSLLLFRPC